MAKKKESKIMKKWKAQQEAQKAQAASPDYTFKKWEHPVTGEKRIYINGYGLKAKVFFLEGSIDDMPELKHHHNSLNDYPKVHGLSCGEKPWEYVARIAWEEAGLKDDGDITWDNILKEAA